MATDITTLTEFIRRVELPSTKPKEHVRLYRGHGVGGLELQPSLFRTQGNRKHEKNILRELMALHPAEFSSDRGVFEQLVRMQHFSLPTRLLDITSNPLVALYFACAASPRTDGEFLRITVGPKAIKYFDSDTVSCIANLANLSGNERDHLRRNATDAQVNDGDAGKRLVQFIRGEKPYFLARIRRADLDGPLVVKPRLTNRRLLAQQGAFMLFGLKTKFSEADSGSITISRSKIPKESKARILESLDAININASVLFPEMESAAKYIMGKISPTSDVERG